MKSQNPHHIFALKSPSNSEKWSTGNEELQWEQLINVVKQRCENGRCSMATLAFIQGINNNHTWRKLVSDSKQRLYNHLFQLIGDIGVDNIRVTLEDIRKA